MEKVIPPGLNYADIKPEAIENQIRIVKFTPQATVVSAKPNDIVRFFIQGNGFYDPYSAYIRITVKPGDDFTSTALSAGQWAARLLDRSAHSLFSRLVIRSQGTELERIEQYDVMAAMVNDMVYSTEQRVLHHYEGFSCNQAVQSASMDKNLGPLNVLQQIYHGNNGAVANNVGDVGWWRVHKTQTQAYANNDFYDDAAGYIQANQLSLQNQVSYIDSGAAVTGKFSDGSYAIANNVVTVQMSDNFEQTGEMTFCLPIYSGILGVMMPDKKLLPLSLVPLEVEFTMNPYAFYGAGPDAFAPSNSRDYTVTKFEIYAHTLFFEQELHRSMEAIVAEHGIFIHYNSFYLAPVTTYTINSSGQETPQYAQINTYAKSINSIHFCFLKVGYETSSNAPRKLHFFSQRLNKLQLRNGMDLIPSEPIQGNVGDSYTGKHVPFLIETYKGFNKMHDPTTDCNINALNYNIDSAVTKPVTLHELWLQQQLLGRCQYALSLEGEQLGEQKQILCGRKGTMPFDINFSGNATSTGQYLMIIFTRADYILYVRPDLVVSRLGL